MIDPVESEEKWVGTWEAVESWLARDGEVFGSLVFSSDQTVEMQIQVEVHGDLRSFDVPGTWHVEKRAGNNVLTIFAQMDLEGLIFTRRFVATIYFQDRDTLHLDDPGAVSIWKRVEAPP